MKGIVIHNEIVGVEYLLRDVRELKKKTEFGDTCEVSRDFLNHVERTCATYLDVLEKTEYNKA